MANRTPTDAVELPTQTVGGIVAGVVVQIDGPFETFGSESLERLLGDLAVDADVGRAEEAVAVESRGALDYTARFAENEADLALQALAGIPASVYRDALAWFAVSRNA